MKNPLFLILFTLSPLAFAGSCWEEARLKSKEDFDRIRDFQENRPISPVNFVNEAEVETYQKGNQEYRDKLRAMTAEAQVKSKQYSEDCRTSSRQSFASERAKSKNCNEDKESQIKFNWSQVTELEKKRPEIPSNFKNKEEFEAYAKAREEFKAQLEQLTNEIKAKNKTIRESPCR